MITLTDNAASKVNELITAEGEDGLALRVAVLDRTWVGPERTWIGDGSGDRWRLHHDPTLTLDLSWRL